MSKRADLSDLKAAVAASREHETVAAAARALGVPRTTFTSRLAQASRIGIEQEEPVLTVPELPDDDIPIEEVIDHMSKRFEKRQERANAAKWLKIDVRDDKPIGVMWFGDPHLDDNGCNWPLLKRHCELCKETPGLYGVNIGDSTNNWSGRLARLYSNQDSSKKTARELVRWFMFQSGIKWLVWLMGNHDAWGDGIDVLKEMGAATIWMEDWESQFTLGFPNGREARVWAAHNFKGNSIWNNAHGNLRAAMLRARAHIYASGHTHDWSIDQRENPDRNHVFWLVNVRGYKFLDNYAKRGGFPVQQHAASAVSVIDPAATSEASFITCFADPEEGAEYLKWKRGRA